MLIWLRWKNLKADTWTNARLVEMCRLLNLTLEEVCAMAGVFSRREINKYWRSNRWPLPVGIHFTQHLSAYYALKFPDIKQKFYIERDQPYA